MALVKSYETKSGIVCENAYHVIHEVKTIKRMVDDSDPDSVRPENAPTHVWKAGVYGRIAVVVYASQEARESGKAPIALYAQYPTDAPINFQGEVHVMQDGTDMNFKIDTSEGAPQIQSQAYAHLMTLDPWQDAVMA
jgi:hypothetical protein